MERTADESTHPVMPLFQQRLDAAASSLQAAGIDAILLGPGADLFYLTGFEHGHGAERLLAMLLRADGSGTWIAPAMNAPQVASALPPTHNLGSWTDAQGYLPVLREATAGLKTIAFDDEARAAFLIDLLAVGPGIRPGKASQVLQGLRIRKDSAELSALRTAARTVDETISEGIALCRPDVEEARIEEDLRAALLRRSPDSTVAFCMVAGGPNTALPHHDTGRRPLQAGEVVILDFGTRNHGYHSDITITCSAGRPRDPDVERIYRVVWEAQQLALESIRPGVSCETVDSVARDHIALAGFGEYFLHRTGHGLGLQVHEPPYLVAGNSTPLEEGMVFSVEPGIYLPGRFGVRLEVITAVTADGFSLINAPSARRLPQARG